MGDAIAERKSTRHIDLTRIGLDFLIAVDESKRLVGILSKLGVSHALGLAFGILNFRRTAYLSTSWTNPSRC
jgi:hypothetical protein